jgi:hypothetical protein
MIITKYPYLQIKKMWKLKFLQVQNMLKISKLQEFFTTYEL